MIFKVHLFKTLEEAETAINEINQGEEIPAFPDSITKTYTQAQENNGKIFILADEVTIKYLGDPTEIEIIEDFEI